MAGMVLETNINHILTAIQEQNKLESTSSNILSTQSVQQTASQAKDLGGMFLSSITDRLRT